MIKCEFRHTTLFFPCIDKLLKKRGFSMMFNILFKSTWLIICIHSFLKIGVLCWLQFQLHIVVIGLHPLMGSLSRPNIPYHGATGDNKIPPYLLFDKRLSFVIIPADYKIYSLLHASVKHLLGEL